MCGRYLLYTEKDVIIEAFQLTNDFHYEKRYNIAPSQNVLAVVQAKEGMRAGYMKWGLIPPWAKDSSVGAKLINARGETIHEKPSFRDSFKKRRCLILANGFYEWKTENGKKQPYRFYLPQEEPFAFAGLWSRWNDGEKDWVTCTIVTTKAQGIISHYHDRMPVMLTPNQGKEWLSPNFSENGALGSLECITPERFHAMVSDTTQFPHNF